MNHLKKKKKKAHDEINTDVPKAESDGEARCAEGREGCVRILPGTVKFLGFLLTSGEASWLAEGSLTRSTALPFCLGRLLGLG